MKISNTLARALVFLAIAPSFAQQPKPAADTPKPPTTQVTDDNAGQRAFEANCSRCHNPPQGFSPHISGTILMHMRVRANLSKKDQQDILRFLNP